VAISWAVPYSGEVTAATSSRIMIKGTLIFLPAHGIDAALQRLVEDALVEKHQGTHRQVLGRGSDVATHRQIGEEGFNLGLVGEKVVMRS
jgi:hypothetical protein